MNINSQIHGLMTLLIIGLLSALTGGAMCASSLIGKVTFEWIYLGFLGLGVLNIFLFDLIYAMTLKKASQDRRAE